MNKSAIAPVLALLGLLALSGCSGCVTDNGDASYDSITDAEYQEASTNGNARTR